MKLGFIGLGRMGAGMAARLCASGYEVAAGQVLVTNGGKQALYNTFAALLDPGDEALLPAPYWTTYPESIRLAGGVPVEVHTDETTGYRVSLEQLEAALTPRTKLLVFVSPSNPTGAVYSPAEVEAIGRWAVEKGIWVVTDEIYEHLVYGDAEFASMPALVPELADRCVVVNGVAKTYAMTGWRVGWLIGPADVAKAATNLQSHATSNVANVSQVAALAAVSGDLAAVAEMRSAFDRRRHTITGILDAIDGVACPLPEGAFYVYPSVKGVLGREIRGKVASSSADLAAVILDEAEVAVVPGEAFGTPGYLRLSYALGDDDHRVVLPASGPVADQGGRIRRRPPDVAHATAATNGQSNQKGSRPRTQSVTEPSEPCTRPLSVPKYNNPRSCRSCP